MKYNRILLVPILFVTVIICSCGRPGEQYTIEEHQLIHRYGRDDPAGFLQVYPFKSAQFSFKASGMGTPDRQIIIHIDEYGHFESQQSIVIDTGKIYNWTVIRGMDLWHLDPDTQTATLAVMDQRVPSGIDIETLADIHGSIENAEQYLEQQSIYLLPDETIDGYVCQVILRDLGHYSIKRWVYQGVDLRMAVVLPPDNDVTITREFVSAKLDIPVDQSHFEIPNTYRLSATVLPE